MKRLFLIIAIGLLFSCTKECDCTYYSQQSTTANPTWKTTYESKWDSCEEEDFGTSEYTHYDGTKTKTHTYVKCK
jgi:hypothetical protein